MSRIESFAFWDWLAEKPGVHHDLLVTPDGQIDRLQWTLDGVELNDKDLDSYHDEWVGLGKPGYEVDG